MGIFFSLPVLTKVVGKLTLIFSLLLTLISIFIFKLFSPCAHLVFFFPPFETSPHPPTYSHLLIPITPTYLLTYTFKF